MFGGVPLVNLFSELLSILLIEIVKQDIHNANISCELNHILGTSNLRLKQFISSLRLPGMLFKRKTSPSTIVTLGKFNAPTRLRWNVDTTIMKVR